MNCFTGFMNGLPQTINYQHYSLPEIIMNYYFKRAVIMNNNITNRFHF